MGVSFTESMIRIEDYYHMYLFQIRNLVKILHYLKIYQEILNCSKQNIPNCLYNSFFNYMKFIFLELISLTCKAFHIPSIRWNSGLVPATSQHNGGVPKHGAVLWGGSKEDYHHRNLWNFRWLHYKIWGKQI